MLSQSAPLARSPPPSLPFRPALIHQHNMAISAQMEYSMTAQ